MKKKYIPRKYYINKISPFIDKEVIKVLIGQRRVGKSYILLQLIDEIKKISGEKNIVYINKELAEFSEIKNDTDLLNFIKIKSKKQAKTYVFIDEIQDIFDFEKAIRSLNAEGGYDIYCTGSNAKMLSGDLATYLSGRYIEFKIFGLSFTEFLQFHKLQSNNDSLMKYIKFGGLPYLINLPFDETIAYEYLRSIYNTIILKDIVSRYNIRNLFLLDNLVRYLVDNFGTLLSAKRISDFLKSQQLNYSPKVILQYLRYLENAFFIHKARRYDIQGKRVFEIGDKYYFEDLGLRNSIVRYNNKDMNKILENLVYSQLLKSGYEVFVGKSADKEIDFVANKGSERIYIQVAFRISDEKTHQREFGNLLEIKDNHRKIVVSTEEFGGSDYKGIEHLHILDFLKL